MIGLIMVVTGFLLIGWLVLLCIWWDDIDGFFNY